MADKYFRRGHWVRKRGSKKEKTSGWVIAAAVVGAVWLWSSLPGDQQESPPTPPSVSESAPPDPAPIAEQVEDEGPPPEPTGAP
ncbi:hypothetical protein [Streptosporangium sp. NPDC000509]|uniref:hypothetical protein n=1 Tax=Streptosporangium sp. NPDC000509 TaxID=3366186 RepID=UPI0036876C9A